jgi:nucleoside-diphosphate-sugar epimerase
MEESRINILGCGWLGLPLACTWIEEGRVVYGSTTSSDKMQDLKALGMTPCLIDLAHVEENVLRDFVQGSIVVVTIPPRSRSQEPSLYVHQMKKLVKVIEQVESVAHVVYTSSTSVYHDVLGPVKERDVEQMAQAFNQSLFAVEQLFLSLRTKKVSILRLGGLTGGSRMLGKHFAGRIDLQGGMQPVNLVHQEDAVAAIRFVIAQGLSGVYNVSAPEHPLKKDFYTALCQRYHLALPHFKEEEAHGKTVEVKKLADAGFSFHYSDPYLFTYSI